MYLLVGDFAQRWTTSNGSISFLALGSSENRNQFSQWFLKEPEQPGETNDILPHNIQIMSIWFKRRTAQAKHTQNIGGQSLMHYD